jgi:DNA-binding CsgD family transcriptional regulator
VSARVGPVTTIRSLSVSCVVGVWSAVGVPFVEREPEFRELRAAVSSVEAGGGRLVVIEGAAGAGKSRLLDVAMEEAGLQGFRVLRAGGSELEREFAFGAVRQLFDPAVMAASLSVRRRLLAGAAAPARWVLAPRGDVHPDGGFVTVHAFYWVAANLAARAPLLVAVDDLHWVDEASAGWLAYMARRLVDVPIVVVVTLRPDEPGAPVGAVEEVRAQADARIVLQPLSPSGAAVVVRARFPGADDELCDAFHVASAGNPLYLQELLRTVAAAGPRSTVAVREASLPSLGERVMRRVRRVGTAAPALATAMAVLGDWAPLPVAAAMADMDVVTASRLARRLVRIEVLVGEDPFAFVHPLVRRSVYDTLTAAERDAAHTRAAELLGAAGASIQARGYHLGALRPAGSETVAVTVVAAAEEALARAAPEAALRFLRRALAEEAPEPPRGVLLLLLGEVEMARRDSAAVEHLQEALGLLDDSALHARAVVTLAELLIDSGRWEPGVELVQSTLDRLGDLEPDLVVELEALRALGMAYLPHLVDGLDGDRARLQLLAEGEEWPARALAGVLAAVRALRGEDIDEVVPLVEHSVEGDRLLERHAGGWAAGQALLALVAIDELDRTLSVCERVETAGRRTGALVGVLTGAGFRGYVHARRGQLADAEAVLRPAIGIAGQTGMGLWVVIGLFWLVDAMLERASLEDLVGGVEAFQPESGFWATTGGAMLLEVRGRLRRQRGDRAGALADLRGCAETNARLRRAPTFSPWRSELALALPAEEADSARALIEEELALARAAGLARPVGVALRAAGIVAGGEAGIGLLRQSVAVLEGCEALLERARSLVELGASLRRRHHRIEARQPLAEGMDLARRCGADRLVARAGEELRAAGARPRRVARSGLDALTASELRVARLAATGRPNVAIAQELYVSRKTVETHLSHAYIKLGLSGQGARQELRVALEDYG